MYRYDYFNHPTGVVTGIGTGGGTGSGSGLTDEQQELLNELALFKADADRLDEPFPISTHLLNTMNEATGAAREVVDLSAWKNTVVAPELRGNDDATKAEWAQWSQFASQSDLESSQNDLFAWVFNNVVQQSWLTNTFDPWKTEMDLYQPQTYQIFDRQTGAFRLRPPQNKVTANGFYVCFPMSHYTFTNNAEAFYFELGTHGSGPVDPIATRSFEFTVFNASPTYNVRVVANNGQTNQPILFVRGSTVSTQVSNTLIGPNQAVRFVFVPWWQSPYRRLAPNTLFEQQCPAFVETDWYANTSPTLLPPNTSLLV